MLNFSVFYGTVLQWVPVGTSVTLYYSCSICVWSARDHECCLLFFPQCLPFYLIFHKDLLHLVIDSLTQHSVFNTDTLYTLSGSLCQQALSPLGKTVSLYLCNRCGCWQVSVSCRMGCLQVCLIVFMTWQLAFPRSEWSERGQMKTMMPFIT